MTMDRRFIIPATMLAGALALAGCGGGSDTPAASTGGGGTPPASTQLEPLTLPADATLGVTTATALQGTIPAGKHKDFTDANGNVRVSCPTGTVPCSYAIRDGQIFANNKAEPSIIPPTPPAEQEPNRDEDQADNDDRNTALDRDNTPNPDWLSNRNLIDAVKQQVGNENENMFVRLAGPRGVPLAVTTNENGQGGGGELTSGGDFSASPDMHGSAIGHAVVDVGTGHEADLRLVHTRKRTLGSGDEDADPSLNDYLVYGAWERRTAAAHEVDDPRIEPDSGVVWTGTIRRTDSDKWASGEAEYNGKALGHYYLAARDGTDLEHVMTEWDGTVNLRANFTIDRIRGKVTMTHHNPPNSSVVASGRASDGLPAGLTTVNLGQTEIRGSVRGSTTIEALDDNGNAVRGATGTGAWNAGFFGADINGQPNGIAGDFRHTSDVGEIEGAFGAHQTDDLERETDQ